MASADGDGLGGTARGLFGPGMARLCRLLAPRGVVGDLDAGNPLCTGCADDFFATDAPRCALRLPAAVAGDRCGTCLRSPPKFDATVALADYLPPVDRTVTSLRFGGRLPLADAFGRLLAQSARAVLQQTDAVCPVPLAFERQSERGSISRRRSPAASPPTVAAGCGPTSCCAPGTRRRRWT